MIGNETKAWTRERVAKANLADLEDARRHLIAVRNRIVREHTGAEQAASAAFALGALEDLKDLMP